MQLVAGRGYNRGRFDKAKKAVFLEWFAATCNAKLAARQAGVAYSTVFRTRMLKPRFAEAWDKAMEQGYARLEAKVLQEQFVEAAAEPIDFDGGFEPGASGGFEPGASEASADGAATPPLNGGFDAPDPGLVDPVMAMQLLRAHGPAARELREGRATRSGRTGGSGRGRHARRLTGADGEIGRRASDDEVRAALIKRLVIFGKRTIDGLSGRAAATGDGGADRDGDAAGAPPAGDA